MTELEKAARQALEALEMALRYHGVMLLSDPPKDAWKYHGVDGEANKAITALRRVLEQQPACNPHPKAPHGFNRNASHSADRYVCDCEGWDAYDAGYQAGIEDTYKRQDALDKKAENARELGLDYEPVALNQGVPPMLPQQKEGETFAVSYEQPADEPVALQMDVIVVNLVRAGINKHHARELAEHFIKHVRPQPAAQWVGLTDEEIKKLAAPSDDSQIPMTGRMWVFVGDIEAKLKEKNT